MRAPLQFTVDGNPVPKGRPRVVLRHVYDPVLGHDVRRSHAFTPPQTKAWERTVAWTARTAMDGRGPLAGDLAVVLEFYRANAIPCDLDNLAKAVLDALNGICYGDDRQIVELHLLRFVDGQDPRVEIEITSLEAR